MFQVWNPEDQQEEVLVMIVRTGFNTVMGAMVRELVAPTKVFIQKISFTAVSTISKHSPAMCWQMYRPLSWCSSGQRKLVVSNVATGDTTCFLVLLPYQDVHAVPLLHVIAHSI